MRLMLSMLVLLVAPAAAPQTPPKDKSDVEGVLQTTDDRVILFECIDENGQVRKTIRAPSDLKSEELIDRLREQGVAPISALSCSVDYSDIEAEEKASDARRRSMGDTVIPLKEQYEQELYYKDRRAKRYAETCGANVRLDFRCKGPEYVDMTKKACEAIGEVCKPVKHW